MPPLKCGTWEARRSRYRTLRNATGNTAAPYSLRASIPHPTVSTPLTWEELGAGDIHPADLTPKVVLERVERLGDLFAPVLHTDQHIA